MEGKVQRHLDGIFRLVRDPVVRKRARHLWLVSVLFSVCFGLITSAGLPGLTKGETGSASADRLWSSGAELNSTTANMEVTSTSGTMSISNTTKRSGDYAYRTNPTSSTGTFYKTFANSAQSSKFWFRQYVNISTAPGANTYILQIGDGASGKISLRLTSSSTLQLRNEEDNADIGTASTALSLNTWYRVELFVDTTTLTSTDAVLLLDGATIASSTAENLAAGVDRWTWGIANSTTADLYFDDLAVNNGTGRAADNWPGDGRLVHLQPDSDGSNSAWIGYPSDTTDYDDIDEVTPNADTDYIRTQTNNQLDDVNLESASSAGIGVNDRIKLASVGVNLRPCGTTGFFACAVSGVDISYQTRLTAGGNTDTGVTTGINDGSGYVTNDDDASRLNQLTTYDLPGTNTAPWTAADLDAAQVGVKNLDGSGIGWRVTAIWLQVEYSDRSGGRLISSGLELNSTSSGVEFTASTGSPAIISATKHAGSYALETSNGGSQEYVQYNFEPTNTSGDYFVRAYLRIQTAVDASDATILSILDTSDITAAAIKITSANTLKLYDEDGEIGSTSTTLSTNTWYRIELRLNTTLASGSHVVDGRIDGSTFASASNRSIGTGIARIGVGLNATQSAESNTNTQGDLLWDDIAVNKAMGIYQNSWPGDGNIIHLRPNANGDYTQLTTNGTCTGGNYGCVGETQPNDATNYISASTSDVIDDYNITDSPLGALDTVNLVSVGVRFRTNSAAQEDFRARLKGAASGITVESNNISPATTTWATNATADPKLYPLTAYTLPESTESWTDTQLDSAQIGVRDVLNGTGQLDLSAIWLLVDYKISSTVTVSGTIYSDEGATAYNCATDNLTIRLTLNGAANQTATCTSASGVYSLALATNPAATDDPLIVFVDSAETPKATTATLVADTTSHISGLNLYQNRVIVRHEGATAITNAKLSTGDNGDVGIRYNVASGNLTTESSMKLLVWSGKTYTPGGTVTTTGGSSPSGDISIQTAASLNMGGSSLLIAGSYSNNGLFSSGNNSTTFTSTSLGQSLSGSLAGSSSFYNLTFNGSGGSWTLGSTVAATNDFIVSNGAINANNYDLTVGRDLTLADTSGVSYTAGSSTISVQRDFTDLGDKLAEDTSTLIMAGTGTLEPAHNERFYRLSMAYAGKITTLGAKTMGIDGELSFNGGTGIGQAAYFDVRCAVSCTPVVFNAPTALSGARDIYFRSTAGGITITIAGADYGSWGVIALAGIGNASTWQLGGNLSTTSTKGPQLEATTGITGSIFTTTASNYSITSGSLIVAPCSPSRTGPWTVNLNASSIVLNSTSDSLTVGSNCGSHTLNLNSSSVTAKGNVNFVNGTGALNVNAGTSTLTFTPPTASVKTYAPNGQSLYNLNINGASTSADVQPSSAVSVTNDLTLTNGRLIGTQNITVNGNVIGSSGAFNLTGGTLEHRVATNKNFGTTSGTTAWTINNLTFSASSVANTNRTIATQAGTGIVIINGTLSLNRSAVGDTDGIILTGGNRVWQLAGTNGNPFQVNTTSLGGYVGRLTPETSTVTYTGNYTSGNTTIEQNPSGSGYYNLIINAAAETYVLEADTTVLNDLTVTAGTLDTTGSSYALSITRDFLINGKFTANNSTVTLSRDWIFNTGATFTRGLSLISMIGNGAILGTAISQFHNLSIASAGKTTTFNSGASRIDIYGTLTVNGGTATTGGPTSILLMSTGLYAPMAFAAPTTITGTGVNIWYRALVSSMTLDIIGGDYGSWNINIYTSSGNDVIWNLAGNVTTGGDVNALGATGLTGLILNTQNYNFTARSFVLGSGSANAANFTLNLGSSALTLANGTSNAFYPSNTGAAASSHTVNMGSSTWYITGSMRLVNGSGSVLINEGTSTVNMTPSASSTVSYAPNGQSLYHFLVNGGNTAATVSLEGAADFNGNLTLSAGRLDTAGFDIDVYDVTMTGTGTVVANASTIIVRGNWTSNTTWQSNLGSSTVSLNGSGKTLECGNTSSSAHFYNLSLVSGSYTQNSNRCNSSNNTVIQGTLSVNSAAPNGFHHLGSNGTSLTITGALNGSGAFYIDGALMPTHNYSGTVSINSFLYRSSQSTTIPATNNTGGSIYFQPTSGSQTYTIGGAITSTQSLILDESVAHGTLTVNNTTNNSTFTLGGNFQTIADSGLYSISLGSASYLISGNWQDDDSSSVNAGTSTVILQGTTQQSVSRGSGANSFYNLTVTNASGSSPSDCERTGFAASVIFSNNLTVNNNLTFTTANSRLQFNNGSTYNLTNINWDGQASYSKIYFRNSISNSGSWLLNLTGSQLAVSHINVSRSDASSGNTINAANGTNVNCGNNLNWSFNNPIAPNALAQLKSDNTPLLTGTWTNESSVKFTANISDGDNPASVQLCVEKDTIATSFSNAEDYCGSLVSYSGTPVAATVVIGGLSDASEYHWQARVKDSGGAYSSWVSFDINSETARDFGVDISACSAPGQVYDGSVTGVDATYNNGSLTVLAANWDAFDCGASGLNKYEYAIGTTSGGTQIKNWTDNGTTLSMSSTGLVLRTNQFYYINVRATDNAGNLTAASTSDGQSVLPQITFSLSGNTVTFSNLNDSNNRLDTKTTTLTTSTNAYGGYVITQYAAGLLNSASQTIPMFSAGSYASPSAWPNTFCSGSTCGFGYTSNDPSIQGNNKFNNATLYAPYSLAAAGDIVADHTSPIDGNSDAVSNEQFTITHKVAVSALQPAKRYTTTIYYVVTGAF